jgi:hypothetical protein
LAANREIRSPRKHHPPDRPAERIDPIIVDLLQRLLRLRRLPRRRPLQPPQLRLGVSKGGDRLLPRPVIASGASRRRPKVNHSSTASAAALDCFVARLLAMTRK